MSYFGISIDEWVKYMNDELSKLYGFKKGIKIYKDDFGYTSYKNMIIALFSSIDTEFISLYINKKPNLNDIIYILHLAWSETYIEYKNANYSEPKTVYKNYLNTNQRNNRCTIKKIEHIPVDDLELYNDFIEIAMKKVVEKVITLGLSNLSIS